MERDQPDGGYAPLSALPDGSPGRSDGDATEATVIEVDGQTFAARPDGLGGTHYAWLSGLNPGYGFTEGPTYDSSVEGHRESIRRFLALVDPVTGFIEGD